MSTGATVEGDGDLRLFLALELPADVVSGLVSWSRRHLSRGRPVSSFHVTLAFLGTQPRAALDPVRLILREETADATPFLLESVRYRETRSVGMLVLADPSGEAARLAERLQRRLEDACLYRREARPWLPHVTVVRFRERPRLDPPLPEIGPFAPSGAGALLSRLHPSGARYEVLESCPLGVVHRACETGRMRHEA
ncbi:MAG: 2'-5' RNA ligase family protein [Gaiellaceae bacterium]